MKKITISIILIIMYFIVFSKVEAAGTVSLRASKTSVNIGDTFTVSINLSGASVATLTARVSFDTSKVDYVSGPSNSNYSGGRVIYTWTDSTGGFSPLTGGTIATFTFKAKAEGTVNFNVSGNFFTPEETSVNPSFSGTSVSIKKVETPAPGGNTGTGTGGESGGGTNTGTGGGTGTNTGTGGNQTGGNQAGGNQTGGSQTGGSQTGGSQTGGSQTGGSQTGGSQTGGNQTGGSQTGGNQSGGNQTGGSQTGGNQSGGNQTGGTQTGGSQTGGNQTGGNQTGGSQTGGNQTGGSQTGGSQTGGSQTGGGQTSGNQTGGNQTGGNQPGGNQNSGNGNSQTGGASQGSSGDSNNQESVLSANNNLKSLQLDTEGISPSFSKNQTQYYIAILENISNITVTAVPEDSKANVQILGNSNIQVGNSKISIVVTAENGEKKEYVINVTKTNNLESANANLENLAIENITLVPEFNTDITDYTAEVLENIDKLNILAVPQIEAATVTIEGNENLQIGENFIKITVLAQDGQTSKVYNISVQKKENTIENAENENLNNNTEENNVNSENVENAIENEVKSKNAIGVIILTVLASLIIGSSIIIVKKKKEKQEL